MKKINISDNAILEIDINIVKTATVLYLYKNLCCAMNISYAGENSRVKHMIKIYCFSRTNKEEKKDMFKKNRSVKDSVVSDPKIKFELMKDVKLSLKSKRPLTNEAIRLKVITIPTNCCQAA